MRSTHPAVDVPSPPPVGHLGVDRHHVALHQGQLAGVPGAEVVAGHRRAHHPGGEDWWRAGDRDGTGDGKAVKEKRGNVSLKGDILHHRVGLAVSRRFENRPLLTSQAGVSTQMFAGWISPPAYPGL